MLDEQTRRRFVQLAAGTTAGLVPAASAVEPQALPKVKFGSAEITKLIIGSNPFYGYSHFNAIFDNMMREWYSQDRRLEVLHRAEAAGINTWQLHYRGVTIDDVKRYRDEGGKMNLLLLADFDLMTNWKLLPEVAKLKPLGIAHHGGRTDERFRNGQMHLVQNFCKAVHDVGLPAGVSTHNPAVIRFVEDKGWNNDFYMTCLYRVTRTPDDARKELGEAPLGEIFMERDPERMCEVVRLTPKTCFAFKILAAGRITNNPARVERAFQFALTNIKPRDAVIVGMFPKLKDEVKENAEIVRRISGTETS
jgi:hypothetical protein